MPTDPDRANSPGLPNDEPRYRIAHLVRDPVLRAAIENAEADLGPVPALPGDKSSAAGSDDAKTIFRRAYCEAMLEKARYEVVDAEYFAACSRGISEKDRRALLPIERRARDKFRDALTRFADVPATSPEQLKTKKAMIGRQWLILYPVFSEAVARDEAYLKALADAQREASR